MKAGSLRNLISNIASASRQAFSGKARPGHNGDIADMCKRLLQIRAEASAISLAVEIIETYAGLDDDAKLAFFRVLLNEFLPNPEVLGEAIEIYQANPTPDTHMKMVKAADSPRQTLLRAINMAPEGTAAIVAMREDLNRFLPRHPRLLPVDSDMVYLLRLWFNRGFLTLERIDWNTPAAILEKLIAYEVVHEIQGWDDLRRRLEKDRRFFAFFHPALPEEPLVFVEVALMKGLTDKIACVLQQDNPCELSNERPDTAIFYSINNCQPGLKGVSFGDFLIKHVTDKLSAELDHIKTFSTLSPIPGFRTWLDDVLKFTPGELPLAEAERKILAVLSDDGWHEDEGLCAELQPVMLTLCAHYLLNVKKHGEPIDPAARFHLRNGARLERINWLGNPSAKGLQQSAGMLVNYVYEPKKVTENHEAYVNEGQIVASAAVQQLLKARVIAA
ncbi:MAG: malonyl-CoA decarboxylase [Gammaproteobacteria bacterium]|nr:malonyl-CoA decarboxylase [Gammaproteobacteria bacterium]